MLNWSPTVRITDFLHKYDLGAKGLPLTITDGDIEGKPAPGILQIVRTYLEFLEADLTSDGKFNIDASNMENLKIQGFEQTLIQEGGWLEVGLPT